jgi:hypothetical protein
VWPAPAPPRCRHTCLRKGKDQSGVSAADSCAAGGAHAPRIHSSASSRRTGDSAARPGGSLRACAFGELTGGRSMRCARQGRA